MMDYGRPLDTATLDAAALHYAREFSKATVFHHVTGNPIAGKSYVLRDLHNLTFKDAFEYVLPRVRDQVGTDRLAEFDRLWAAKREPRREDMFEELLARKLAIRPDGTHIDGRIGTTVIGSRVVGTILKEQPRALPARYRPRSASDRILFRNATLGERLTFARRHMIRPERVLETVYVARKLKWHVYAGEVEERLAESGIADLLPEGAWPWSPAEGTLLATNPRMSAECAILACDAIVDNLDEGDAAATIRVRTGAQPADPDAAESGTLLATLTMSDPAFGNAADTTGDATASASAITDDTSADATGTAGYCRAGATGTGADDHLDGEAGTSGADFNFNTVSFTAGATVSMSSFDVLVSQT